MAAYNAYLALGSLSGATFTELTSPGYARAAVALNADADGIVQNDVPVIVPVLLGPDRPRFSAFAIYDAASGGNLKFAWRANIKEEAFQRNIASHTVAVEGIQIAFPGAVDQSSGSEVVFSSPFVSSPAGLLEASGQSLATIAAYLATATLAAGILTASSPMVHSQTWNNAGVTFVGRSNDITDTASAAASLLERWRVGGVEKFSIGKGGQLNTSGAITSTQTTGGLILSHPTMAAYPTKTPFNLSFEEGGIITGCVDPLDRWMFGVNAPTSGVRTDLTRPSIEMYFATSAAARVSNTIPVDYFVLGHTDSNGVGNGGLTFEWARTGTGWSDTKSNTSTFGFNDAVGNSKVQFNWTTGLINVNDSVKTRYNVNNVPIVEQLNGAGNATVSLPYVNGSNQYIFSLPILMSAAHVSGSCIQLQPTGGATTNAAIRVQGPVITGSYQAYDVLCSASTFLQNRIRNEHASGDARMTLEAAGDPKVLYHPAADVATWAEGLDNSDSDKFKISNSDNLGTNDRFEMTVAGLAKFFVALGVGTDGTTTSFLALAAGTTAKATMNIGQGAAPTSPVDGDVWREDNTNTGWKIRVNGVTKTVSLA